MRCPPDTSPLSLLCTVRYSHSMWGYGDGRRGGYLLSSPRRMSEEGASLRVAARGGAGAGGGEEGLRLGLGGRRRRLSEERLEEAAARRDRSVSVSVMLGMAALLLFMDAVLLFLDAVLLLIVRVVACVLAVRHCADSLKGDGAGGCYDAFLSAVLPRVLALRHSTKS